MYRVKSTLSYRLLNELVLTHTFNDYSFYAVGEGCFIMTQVKPLNVFLQLHRADRRGFEEYKEIIIRSKILLRVKTAQAREE